MQFLFLVGSEFRTQTCLLRMDFPDLRGAEGFLQSLFNRHRIVLYNSTRPQIILDVRWIIRGDFLHSGELSFHEVLKAGHDFRVEAGDVGLFVWVRLQVKELHFFRRGGLARVGRGWILPRLRLLEGGDNGVAVGSVIVDPDIVFVSPLAGSRGGAVELPAAFPGRHKVDSVPSEDGPIGALATALKEVPNIVSIELVRIGIDIEKTANGREEVDGGAGGVDGLCGGNLAGPSEYPRYSDSPFPRRSLHAAMPTSVAAIPRAVVR